MPGGRHGHKMREFQRRIDVVLEKEQERRKPPPISEEHAALRRQIAEASKPLLDVRDPEDPEDFQRKVRESPELLDVATEVLDLRLKEKELLAKHGVDYRSYQTYDLS
jgi:hypothetical protein